MFKSTLSTKEAGRLLAIARDVLTSLGGDKIEEIQMDDLEACAIYISDHSKFQLIDCENAINYLVNQQL